MEQSFTDRLNSWRDEIVRDLKKRWWWVFFVVAWFFISPLIEDRIVGAANRYIDAHILAGISIPPGFWQRVLVGAVLPIAVLVCVLLIHAYIASRRARPDRPREHAARALPETPPAVRPYEYGKDQKQNLYGLFVTNPGYAAFDVHIPPVQIGSSGYMLIFRETLAQLLERDHKRFISAWLEHATLPGRDGSELFAIMREAQVDLLNFGIVYKDNAAQPSKHRTNCSIERDVEITGGLRVRYINQELVEEWEPAGRGGPELVVSYKPPIGTSFAGKSKEMFVENASDTDAHNVRLQDISISADESIIATFPLVP